MRASLSFPLALALAASAAAQCDPLLTSTLLDFGPSAEDAFGSSVALGSDWLAVGVPGEAPMAPGSGGAVQVFRRTLAGWSLDQEIARPATERFGAALDLEGDELVVGSPGEGRVHFFRRSAQGWAAVATPSAPSPQGGLRVAFVPAAGAVALLPSASGGSVAGYVRTGSSWGLSFTQLAQGARLLTADDSRFAHDDPFGRVLVRNWVGGAVGPPAFVLPPQLGLPVAALELRGETLLVGVPGADAGGPVLGAVREYRLEGTSWTLVATRVAPDALGGGGFGSSLAVAGGRVHVGEGEGRVHVFETAQAGPGEAWLAVGSIDLPDADPSDSHVPALAARGTRLVVGLPARPAAGGVPAAGEVRVYETLVPAAPIPYCTSVPNSSGQPARLAYEGSTLIAADDARLVLTGAPPGQHALVVYAREPALLPFGIGLLCVSPTGPPMVRLRPGVAIDAAGRAVQPLDFGTLPPGGQIAFGDTWNFQAWFRDPAGPVGFNTSDAVRVTFCN